MKKIVVLLLASLVLMSSCESVGDKNQASAQEKAVPVETVSLKGQNIKVYDFESFEPWLYKDNDTVYVINFWASWCKPCIKEMPYFEKLNDEFSSQKVKVLLVSLDFRNQLENKLIPFINKTNLAAEVIMLNDPDANSWINRVDGQWTGSIPATLFYKGDKRMFYEKEVTYQELESIVKSLI
jgi:thiol-disulfide isomerase/thioredoxin